MAIKTINSVDFKQMFLAGAKYLESKKRYCNELNVFPVPDGDTGTNMTLTILAAVKEVNNVDPHDMRAIAKAISSGSLRGARGNSGVILSQLFRGIAKEIAEYDTIDGLVLAAALTRGAETAYKAVMKPKEGTILTVANEAAKKAVELAAVEEDLVVLLKGVIDHAEITLQRTPDLLPVLKEAGVVDAGGQGFLYILRGAHMVLEQGGDVELHFEMDDNNDDMVEMTVEHVDHDIEFGYCTEFIINVVGDLESERESIGIKRFLETIGDSIVAVADDDIIKIHVHTNEPGLALQKALSVGSLSSIKIDNMREQHQNLLVNHEMFEVQPKDFKDHGFVVISVGDGISEIFKSLGADTLVQGGQTMNPSTEDILTAIKKVPAKHVYVLPNNKNIILAAEQARDLVEDRQVHVIPSKSIPQGISAMIGFEPNKSGAENQEIMSGLLQDVKTGQITYAVRDTNIEGHTISIGQLMGICDDHIQVVKDSVKDAAEGLIASMVDEDAELLTIYYGEEVDVSDAEALMAYVETHFKDVEVECHYGGQPIYYYILSME